MDKSFSVWIALLGCLYLCCYISSVDTSQYPRYCSKNESTFQNCARTLNGINCEYIKVKNLSAIKGRDEMTRHTAHVEQYVARKDEECRVALNITWSMPWIDWNADAIGGFLLIVNYSTSQQNYSIVRFFRLRNVNYRKEEVLSSTEEMLYYDCLRVSYDALYTVELFILHKTQKPRPNHSQAAVQSIMTTKGLNYCSTEDMDVKNTWWWMASSSVLSLPQYNKLRVCFLPAPSVYGYSLYHIQLLLLEGPPVKHINVTAEMLEEDVFSCFEFTDVIAGEYKVWFFADSANCKCVKDSQCFTYCAANEIPINITGDSSCIGTHNWTTLNSANSSQLGPHKNCLTHASSIEPSGLETTPTVIGTVMGIACIVLILTCLAVCVILRHRAKSKCLRGKSTKDKPSCEVASSPSLRFGCQINADCEKKEIISGRVPILMIYAHDNDAHRHVVHSLAMFLESCCGCTVVLDEWCHDDIARLGSHEWLHKQICSLPNIIIVHSELGLHQLLSVEENYEVRRKVSGTVLEDTFAVAVRLLRSRALADLGMKGNVKKRTDNERLQNFRVNNHSNSYSDKSKNVNKPFWLSKKCSNGAENLNSVEIDSSNSDAIDEILKNSNNNSVFTTKSLQSYSQRYFHVVFPYSKDSHVIDMFRGLTFHLMNDLDHLFLDIHSCGKFSRNGVAVCDMNVRDYNQTVAGKKLEDAISEAVSFHSIQTDWFVKMYEIKPTEYCTSDSIFELSPLDSADDLNNKVIRAFRATDDTEENCSLLNEEDMCILHNRVNFASKYNETDRELESSDPSVTPPMDSGFHSGERFDFIPSHRDDHTSLRRTDDAILNMAEHSSLIDRQEMDSHPNITHRENHSRGNYLEAASLRSLSSMGSFIPPDSLSDGSVSLSDLQRLNESDYSGNCRINSFNSSSL